MSERDAGSPNLGARIRRWLWLDRTQRTDRSEANRGFYPGGMPVYSGRKPVGRRFVLPVVALGIVIALLIIVARQGDARSGDGQVLVFDEPGFAVTVPADWTVETEGWWKDESEGGTVWAMATDGEPWSDSQTCVIYTQVRHQKWLLDLRACQDTHCIYESVDLPAGPALVIEDPQFRPHTVVEYRIPRGITHHVIACNALEPPEDLWRPIAESLEFLRDEHEYEVPDLDVVLTFPGEWTIKPERGKVAGAPGWFAAMWATDGVSTCRLQRQESPASGVGSGPADEPHAGLRAWLDARRAHRTGSAAVELPVGSATRTDWVVRWDEGQMPHSTYELEVNGIAVRLVCFAAEPPEDRWLQLAQTLTPADQASPLDAAQQPE